MARTEGHTDLWVNQLLKDAGIQLDYQSSSIKPIDEALHTASKKLNGKPGYPEYVGVVKDFLIVIEDKASLDDHVLTKDGVIVTDDPKAVSSYALNGALHYAKHILARTSYKKCFAIGVSGNEKLHKISPLYVGDRGDYKELPNVESFVSFNDRNIDEYYLQEVLHEATNEEKTTAEVLKDAAQLHEQLRTYGQLKDVDKPLVVSGILLALREGEAHNFNIDDLTGDTYTTDGQKIMEAIKSNLRRSQVAPEVKRDKLLNQFSIITDSAKLNTVDKALGMTPLRYYTEFIDRTIYQDIRYTNDAEDYLGRFYGEFMSYSGGDGQSLGIILTPKHITELFCDLVDLKPNDVVLDPTCGTAGFLIAAMHKLLSQTDDQRQRAHIRKHQLFGIEYQDYMFTIATTNMILRGDGKSNLKNEDFLAQNPAQLQTEDMATVGMMNPPYSQGTKNDPDQYEISFIRHLLDSLGPGARCAVIVPQSTMVGKTKVEKQLKEAILQEHTLEGVITCNPNTFYGVGVNPVIALFTAHEPHPADKQAKFIDFRNDGFEVRPHIGLVATSQAKDRKQYLLDVWRDNQEAPSKFCVQSTVQPSDEWLHSFYYFNDEIPTDADFEKSIGDYLSFQFSMIMQGREDLFTQGGGLEKLGGVHKPTLLDDSSWQPFKINDLFEVKSGQDIYATERTPGSTPYITSGAVNNGVGYFVGNENNSRDDHVISVNRNGAVGEAFYHPYSALFGNDSRRLLLRHGGNYLQFFVARSIANQKSAFGYGRKLGTARLKVLRIMLPATADGAPDYDYMENYARYVMAQKYRQYLKFAEERLAK